MKNITDIITPISLKAGSHSDTAQTGQGCFMNVIAYLNGEPQITDQSPCVCVTIRPIAIFANDFLKDDERNALKSLQKLQSMLKQVFILSTPIAHV